MSIAIIANGTLLQIGDGTSPEEFTTVPEVMKLSGLAVKFDILDVTSHDSVGFFREFITGLADGDAVNFDFNWKPSNEIHILLRTNSYARTLTNFQAIFPDDSDNQCSVQTYITNIAPTADIGAVLRANSSLKITGQPEWSDSV